MGAKHAGVNREQCAMRYLYFFARLYRVFRCQCKRVLVKGIVYMYIYIFSCDFYLPRVFPSFSLADITDSSLSSRIGFLGNATKEYRIPSILYICVNTREIKHLFKFHASIFYIIFRIIFVNVFFLQYL